MRGPSIATITATRDRPELLVGRSIPSIAAQSLQPQRVVVVNDGDPLSTATRAALVRFVDPARLTLFEGVGGRGPGAAWNTALRHLQQDGFSGFVALLDDDDEWRPNHLMLNAQAARRANLVVSGLELVIDGRAVPRPLIDVLSAADFLVGNPGWQGSNTFVDLGLLMNAGGFREDLASLHDRDLAIRLLGLPHTQVALVPHWTAVWHLCSGSSLSAWRSPAKGLGLRQFWRLYGARMTPAQRRAFFERAVRLFGFGEAEITR